jgi:hypothetical protein
LLDDREVSSIMRMTNVSRFTLDARYCRQILLMSENSHLKSNDYNRASRLST